jgi:hypothetical protein
MGPKERTMMMVMIIMTTVLEGNTAYGVARTWWFAGEDKSVQ